MAAVKEQKHLSLNFAIETKRYCSRDPSLRASSPFGFHARFILGEIYLGLARHLARAARGLGRGRGKESLPP